MQMNLGSLPKISLSFKVFSHIKQYKFKNINNYIQASQGSLPIISFTLYDF